MTLNALIQGGVIDHTLLVMEFGLAVMEMMKQTVVMHVMYVITYNYVVAADLV